MTKRIVIISDTQMPYEDRKAVKAVIRFVAEYQPDEVVQIGDLVDYPTPSRWTKDTRGEFEGSVKEDSNYVKEKFLSPLREVFDGPIGVVEGNHDLRPREYLRKYAPALDDMAELFNIENLLDFDRFGITKLPDFYEIAPGWVATHGHLGGIRLSPIAGNTALNAAKRFGKSVVMGHTHRLGIGSFTNGYGGNVEAQVTGFEVGNLMNMKLATYLKGATANWQQGIGILHVDGKHVRPEVVPIVGRKFTVEGQTYSL